jgi:beta-N-acetylhexosaminidase
VAKDIDMKEKVGQRLMIGINGKTIDSETEEHLKEIKPGSIILFSRNISSAKQVGRLITQIHELLPSPPLIAIDQEGGRVIRFTRELTVFPGNMALGATDSPDLAYQQGLSSASQLKDIGINCNLAPVVDVITSHHNPGITIRSFGDDPERASDFACAFIEGTQKAGVAAVAKHFPGKGAAEVDAHFDLPTVSISEKTFEEIHILPFKKAIENGVKGIMSTHIYCPMLDSEDHHPATFSQKIVKDHIRTKLNYNGVIFSDDLEMGAIVKHYGIPEACIKATLAGHDMLLICSNYQWQKQGFHALLDAYTNSLLPLEELDASVERIHNLKNFCSVKIPSNQYKTSLNPEVIAQKIAQQSITIISNKKHLLPIDSKKTKEILLLIPDLSKMSFLEEGYEPTEKHFLIKECKHYFPGKVRSHFFSLNPEHGKIEQIGKFGNKQTLCIAFISNAQGNQGQKLLIKKVRQWYDNIIFVLTDNPFDCEFMSPNDTCITSYGFRKTQLLSLLMVIFGKSGATGKLPFKVK